MNLKCTKKLLDMLKIKAQEDTGLKDQDTDIENWHCNIIDFNEVYAVLLTNDKTLFSFFIFGYTKNDFKDFTEIIKQNIFKLMLNMGFEQKQFEIILGSMENIIFSKSDDRKILASMNQMMPLVYHQMDNEEDLLSINISLNDMPNNKLDWKTPKEEFVSMLNKHIANQKN